MNSLTSEQNKYGDSFIDFRIENEPWYVSTRASQKDRFDKALALISKHCGSINIAYDIGCADGQFSARLAALAGEVYAWDINEERVLGNVDRFYSTDNLHFSQKDILCDPLPHGRADLISALEILYYFSLEEQKIFMKTVRDMLKDGGYVIISVNVFFNSQFTEDSMIHLLKHYFRIVSVKPIYRNTYYHFELKMIRFIDELNYLEKLRIFTPNILKLRRKFYPGKWNRLLLQPSKFIDNIVIPLARWGALRLLGSRIIYFTVTYLTRIFDPIKGKSQVLFLVQKEGGTFACD